MAGNNATKSVLGELAKRVPNNQKKQFRKFLELNKEYKKRLNKYPEKLPKIDWRYYRTNVRIEAIKMVDEFEKKYEELNKVFDDRVKLDTKKYYVELEKQRAVMQAQIKQYIAESNERVKAYEAEIERLCNMKPYSSMTIEEFINLRPECSNYIPHQRRPLFWPHDPEEQTPGPAGIMIPDRGGGGAGKGGAGSKHSIKPVDIKGDTECFEFKEPEAKPLKVKQEAVTKAVAPEKMSQAEAAKSVEEPKPYIDKPASKEERQKLDPCGIVEKQEKKEKTKTVAVATEQMPQKVETVTEPQKKLHPCDMVKKTQQQTTKGDVTCETGSKGPYKDETKRTCVFVDPCNVGLEGKVTKKVEPVPPKVEPKTQPMEPKKTQPSDISKKKPDPNKDPCKSATIVQKKSDPNEEICKSASIKRQNKDARGKCVFFDPCNVGFGVEIPAKVEPAVEKTTPKTEPKPQSAEPKTTQPFEVVKKKPDPGKDMCKSVVKKEQSKPMKPKNIHPCEIVKKKPDTNAEICTDASKKGHSKDEKGACVFVDPCNVGIKADSSKPHVDKVAVKAKPKPQPMESKKAHPCEVVKKKTDPDKDTCKNVAKKELPKGGCVFVDPCSDSSGAAKATESRAADSKLEKTTTDNEPCTLQPIQPKEVKDCDDVKKPKAETDMIKDKNSCTMVFTDPKGAKSDRCKEDKKEHSKPCGTLPYYNPFRSEEENRKNEEKICEDIEEDDPCASDKIEEDYYNPCKDDKDED